MALSSYCAVLLHTAVPCLSGGYKGAQHFRPALNLGLPHLAYLDHRHGPQTVAAARRSPRRLRVSPVHRPLHGVRVRCLGPGVSARISLRALPKLQSRRAQGVYLQIMCSSQSSSEKLNAGLVLGCCRCSIAGSSGSGLELGVAAWMERVWAELAFCKKNTHL
ncbi:hypothetical protein B0T25DRAFT_554290 [Lasiosphaeria hispida]|uniref:Uncharacterized protein n=1 Tax=Lasiosphaeria hispida TaxID=260671 RepID=A0AAJ0H7V6_9PEZI|nr:hypothetical protein B0T25DRAFT_554290 [Lasiosphaeria hispida]